MSTETKTVKFDTNEGVRETEIPDGFRRVWSGPVIPGDQYLNLDSFGMGVVEWSSVFEEGPPTYPYDDALCYSLVIRRGESCPEKTCEHCEVRAARRGNRFCEYCEGRGVHRV